VELGFGVANSVVPAWTLDLGQGRALLLRGRIDRIDLWRDHEGRARAVVMDYKSRSRQLDAVKLQHGLELQLLSYLGVLRHVSELRKHFRVRELVPAGVFYLNLSARRAPVRSRKGADGGPYQHLGRFDGGALALFDTRPNPAPEQFRFVLNRDGALSRKGSEALPPEEFLALMETVEEQLREHGRRIFAGLVAVDPYRKGREKACDRCDYRPICRFDPWTQNFRVLRKGAVKGAEES
jgi:ATP-dependent helicase/nuclease subunit B